jgi:hypothetical protein
MPWSKSNNSVLDVPVIAVASDDVEAELARLSALLGVATGNLSRLQRQVEDAVATVSGYSLHNDGSVSLHFSSPTALTDLLAGSLAVREAGHVVDELAAARGAARCLHCDGSISQADTGTIYTHDETGQLSCDGGPAGIGGAIAEPVR